MAQKLLENHRRFILGQVAAFEGSPADITKKLRDDEYAARYGFTAVIVTPQAVGKKIKTLKAEEIEVERGRYLASFDDTPLAFRKKRVEALVAMIKAIDKDDSLSSKNKFALQLAAYRDIKAEIGEDIDKLADAIGRSGGTHVVNLYAGLGESEQRTKFGNLAAIASRLGDRLRPCSN